MGLGGVEEHLETYSEWSCQMLVDSSVYAMELGKAVVPEREFPALRVRMRIKI